uniref:Uncharacterized protein n=1 Tax=Arundo donax TaxID=35708 RepID=A0A0A9LLW9_ARUDO
MDWVGTIPHLFVAWLLFISSFSFLLLNKIINIDNAPFGRKKHLKMQNQLLLL